MLGADFVLALFVGVVVLAGAIGIGLLVWIGAKQMTKSSTILDRNQDQQKNAQRQLDRVEDLHDRSSALVEQQERLLRRQELLLDRVEKMVDRYQGPAKD